MKIGLLRILVKLGGEGVEVEIDESKFGKRKYNRGRIVEGPWVFGGVDKISGDFFMVTVPKRDKDIIGRH